tara:strand:- start:71 stop:223 length:153 start_codon:yes stop_codon:yes gene_type:complete
MNTLITLFYVFLGIVLFYGLVYIFFFAYTQDQNEDLINNMKKFDTKKEKK